MAAIHRPRPDREIDAASVVTFWEQAGPGRWFAHDTGFDERFRTRFLDAHDAAAQRRLDHWQDTAEGMLALVLLTDQFPRNAFRGTAHMYATDALARHYARQAQARGHVETVAPPLRLFFCLPFAHSEEAADQDLSVQLHERLLGEPWLSHARRHRDIVRHFGRFPHRNPMFGRDTTPEEHAFLAAGGFAG